MTKGKPISEDLRWAIVRMHTLGIHVERIAQYTDISKRQVYRVVNYFVTTGNVLPANQRKKTGRTRHLTTQDIAFLHGSLDQSCDKYLEELQLGLEETCGRSVSLSTIWRALKRSGYTMVKITRVAAERSVVKRAQFKYRTGLLYSPWQLVFVDESSCDRRTSYRGFAWAIKGQRAVRKAFFIRGKRYSVLPAISLDGILYVSILEGSFTTETFIDFIDGLLDQMNPFPGPNSVIVMDNCRIHKSEDVQEMIEARGMRCEYLPPYSPDYNPMEPGFSKMKAYIRREGQLYRAATESLDEKAAVLTQLHNAVYSITPEDAEGWFRHSGYF